MVRKSPTYQKMAEIELPDVSQTTMRITEYSHIPLFCSDFFQNLRVDIDAGAG
jgi:hypothetical protein